MLKLLLGDPNTRKLKRYQPIVEEINFLEEEISNFLLKNNCNVLKVKFIASRIITVKGDDKDFKRIKTNEVRKKYG